VYVVTFLGHKFTTGHKGHKEILLLLETILSCRKIIVDAKYNKYKRSKVLFTVCIAFIKGTRTRKEPNVQGYDTPPYLRLRGTFCGARTVYLPKACEAGKRGLIVVKKRA